jgi:GT2 family glycosyltransferase
MNGGRLTIGITTRNRPDALRRCLRSLAAVSQLSPEVIVFDDASEPPVLQCLAAWAVPLPVRVIRDDDAPGYITGRNRMMREASTPAVLLMDDDAALVSGESIGRALRILEGDNRVGAIAFAQCGVNGARWDEAMQPGRSEGPCYVPSFIGFAHMLRRDVFLAVGGYRESFEYYGEEKDYCLRLIDAGYRTVYLRDDLVIHEPDPSGRSRQRYLRYVTRNDCLGDLYNQRLSRLVWLFPTRFALYFRMRRAWKIVDPWGWAWILGELWKNRGSVYRDRKPVSRQTLETWKRLRTAPQPYESPTLNGEP